MGTYSQHVFLVASLLVLLLARARPSSATTRRFDFHLEWKSVRQLCHTKPPLTVNGEYHGPTIAVNEGDNVEIKVTNGIASNTTLHWHGIRQIRTRWADGPAYVTQYPILPSRSYTYRFTVTGQRGTLWWHAHFAWQRPSANFAII